MQFLFILLWRVFCAPYMGDGYNNSVAIRPANDSLIFEIERIISSIELFLERPRPSTIREALEYETVNLYIYYSLKCVRGKLTNDLDTESIIESVKGLRKYFGMAAEMKERVDDRDDKELLKRLYR